MSSPDAPEEGRPTGAPKLVDSHGWDGKLRLPSASKQAVLANPDVPSDPDNTDDDAPPVEQIEADEDLLDDYEPDAEDIDLVHCRITSTPALRLERFPKVQRLCLRQNQISEVDLPPSLGASMLELDL